ncbi:MAG: COX15/CtaA family protein [Nitrososphaerota archaeon]|nr:COX15/CtaA family protein [Nitrososphaerota archaeon]MDG6971439.1 COX15/CtaA family protein [Nitrososphaerota archaeon]MDG6984681.1 COX15/CtaA family protein [Nitrososphaerota archaeon]MDG6986788.1 COX15/CtaA family protein [Nitrososphaerota archaeon]MDG6992601.1 COX15/CtaA family protein [Nitrososphaerota archaeon]
MPNARHWVYGAAIATYVLSVWGAYVTVGDFGAGCGTGLGASWPLCNGALFPSFAHYATLIEYIHRMLSVVAGLVILYATVKVWRVKPRPSLPSKLMLLAIVLIPIQVGIGGGVIASGLAPTVATTHFAFALVILATIVFAGALMFAEARQRGLPAKS